MISRAELRRSVNGAWRVFLGLPDAMRAFDTSAEGFWRSFQAIIVVAPIYLITAMADWRAAVNGVPPDAGFSDPAFWAAQFVTLALDWVALPALLAALGGFLGIRRHYGAFIVVRNWSTVVIIAPFALISILEIAGLLSPDVIIFPSLIALGFALRFSYMIARTALGVAIEVAIGIVALDFLVSFGIVRIVTRMFGVAVA